MKSPLCLLLLPGSPGGFPSLPHHFFLFSLAYGSSVCPVTVNISHSCSPDAVPGTREMLNMCLERESTRRPVRAPPPAQDAAYCQLPAPPSSVKVKAASGFQTQDLLFLPAVICYKPRQ